MKKLIGILLLTAVVNSVASTITYCPETIRCTQAGKKESCKYRELVGGYFGEMLENGRIQEGIYKFEAVTSGYEVPGKALTQCRYINQEAGFPKTLILQNNPVINLQATREVENLWGINGYSASCFFDVKTCPLAPYQEPNKKL